MDREAWHAAIQGIAKSQTRLSNWTEPNMAVIIIHTERIFREEYWKVFVPAFLTWSPSRVSHELTYIWYLNFKLRDLIGAHVWEGFPSGSAVKSPPVMQKTEETWAWSLGREDPLEEEVATHSSILAWRIPRTEEPGGLQTTGSQRVRHDWSDQAHAHTHVCLRIVICCSIWDQGQEILPPSLSSFFLFSCFLFFFFSL